MGAENSPVSLLAAGLRAFFRLAEEWRLTEAEQLVLLGCHLAFDLSNWRQGDVGSADADTLQRVSYLLGIYQAIHTLLPDPVRANGWIRKANTAPLFHGESALSRMLKGGTTDLQAVRAYLDAQLM
ncbi:antitoxin Xre/MbcA/ParS toxin-binding domain-containing protein [Pararhizobium sp.]|uniref:antitoxin Xre/MbcA/ParS toxin-binding domain-containing protein n=1 Tax=Pararhizobium sp. TaxID=1977563 RepID=UPI00271A2078|nr:antitoxin Xre/MbcA/ParS toxin-binding domain-containing protein [Pararhizobium sp.]MDO9417365.1 DUF2384 domain-containing protein [Pararhizobium sp.]